MSDPPDRPGGRHLLPAEPPQPDPGSRPPWDVLADARSALRSGGSGGQHEPTWMGRRARLWSEVFDRLPARGQRVALDLGRHWWFPVVAALAALSLTVAVAVRERPTAAAAVTATVSPTAAATTGIRPTGSPTATAAPLPSGAAAAPSLTVGAGVSPAGTGVSAPAAATTRGDLPTAVPVIVVVDVAGRVHHPGVVRLPAGSRVVDAIRAAGGSLPRTDLTPLNLAELLRDGEQVRVGLPGVAVVSATGAAATGPESTAAPAPGSASAGPPASPVDLNSATAAALDSLPGIGPVLASRIIDWRTAHGPFGSVDDLEDVPGIGPVSLEKLRKLVTVGR